MGTRSIIAIGTIIMVGIMIGSTAMFVADTAVVNSMAATTSTEALRFVAAVGSTVVAIGKT